MTTIAPQLATATAFAARHARLAHLAVPAQPGAAADSRTVATLILVIMLLAAVAWAVRWLAVLLAPLIRLVVGVFSVLFVTMLSGALLVIILMHS